MPGLFAVTRLEQELALFLASEQPRSPRPQQRFRVGQLCFDVVADDAQTIGEFNARYGDCAVADAADNPSAFTCAIRAIPGSPLLWLSFAGVGLPDLIEMVLTPVRVLRHMNAYAEIAGPLPGWRLLVDPRCPVDFLVACKAGEIVINLSEAATEYPYDCVISVAQAMQPGVLFLHAASIGIAGGACLLIGPSGAGKSTTAIALACRGHRFLGDDVAPVRLATKEVLPFPKSAGLRDGVFVRSIEARVRASRHTTVMGANGLPRTLVQVGDLAPSPCGGSLPLRHVLLLDGFARDVRLSPFKPAVGNLPRLKAAVSETTPWWGISPGRDLMKFLAILDLLAGVDCHLLTLGSTEATVAQIETMMEAQCN